jgi:protein-disulfide isomerase
MPPKPRKPPPRKQSGNRNLLIAAGAAAAVVLVLVGASLLLRGGDSNGGGGTPGQVTGITEASALLDGIPQDRALLGSPKAKVTMIQFEDLQCPICRRYQAE